MQDKPGLLVTGSFICIGIAGIEYRDCRLVLAAIVLVILVYCIAIAF